MSKKVSARKAQSGRPSSDKCADSHQFETSWRSSGVRIAIATVSIAIVLSGLVRWRLADTPLERDEGEYAYAGQVILQGEPPYAFAYNMKFPGTYYAYAAVMALLGESPRGIHVGLFVVNALSAVALFLIAARLSGPLGAAVASIAFLVLSLDRGVFGTSAHATHFVLVPMLWGLVILSRPAAPWSRFVAGLLFGAAVLMKQQATLFLPFALVHVVLASRLMNGLSWRSAALDGTRFALGSVTPFLLLSVLLWSQGVFARFWFWTFEYARTYVSVVPLSQAWPALNLAWGPMTEHTAVLWWIGFAGLAALWLGRWSTSTRWIVTGWCVAAFLAVCPGFYFRPHYFIVLLPAVAMSIGIAVVTLSRLTASPKGRSVAAGAFCVVAGLWVSGNWTYLTAMTPRELSRSMYGGNPFVESPEIAAFIQARTGPDERVAVIGSEPQIYFYANRKSATGYIYTYSLMEAQPFAFEMQKEMIAEIERISPRFLVVVAIPTSWSATRASHREIFDWVERFTSRCYERAGAVDIHSAAASTVVWGDAAATYKPRSANTVYTYERVGAQDCSVIAPTP